VLLSLIDNDPEIVSGMLRKLTQKKLASASDTITYGANTGRAPRCPTASDPDRGRNQIVTHRGPMAAQAAPEFRTEAMSTRS
jgi:hypothetical protein